MMKATPILILVAGPAVFCAGCTSSSTPLTDSHTFDAGPQEPLAFEIGGAIGARHRVHLDVVELVPLEMTKEELASSPVTSALARLLEADLDGLRDPELGLDASVSAVLESLGPIQPGMEQTLTASSRAAQGPTWFVERHVSTVAKFDDIDWCQPQAPASLQARYQSPEGGVLVHGPSSDSAARRVHFSEQAIWIPTAASYLWPLPAWLPTGHDVQQAVRSSATSRALVTEIDHGAGHQRTISACFERRGEHWLPTLYWDSDPGRWTQGCSITYTDVQGLGWRPACTTQFSWESREDKPDVQIVRTAFKDWAPISTGEGATLPVVVEDYGTWPEEVRAFFPAVSASRSL